MVYCVQVIAAASTTTRRNQMRTALQNLRLGKQTWGEVVDVMTETPAGAFGLSNEVRFVTELDATAFFTGAETELRTRPALVGSVLIRHVCTHDDPSGGPCVVEARVVI